MTNLLSDIITYVRRIIKSPSNSSITDDLIVDYINRFWIIDVDARLQMFDLKTKYQFQTSPGIDQYNMPLYSVQTQDVDGSGNATPIGMFPVYQGFFDPCFINGIQMPFYTSRNSFYNLWPSYNQTLVESGIGDGSAGPYTLNLPFLPNSPGGSDFPTTSGLLRGHVDITGIIATGVNQDPPLDSTGSGSLISNSSDLPIIPSTSFYPQIFITTTGEQGQNVVVSDTGIFLGTSDINAQNYGLLMTPGPAPYGNSVLPGGYSITSNTVNYLTGIVNVTFPVAIPAGQPISTQAVYYQLGIPRAALFYNNVITLRAPPNTQYLIELDAYLTPAAFFNTSQAIPFGYMAEYIARGAARKILADTGDTEQFYFYEPLFREQELLVWKRSQRQFTSTRSQTIYSQQGFQGNYNQSSFGI
jgi:hypothetical protein